MTLPDALAPLATYRRFVTYETYPDPDRPGKTIKRPTDIRTGLYCKVTNPAHHYAYADAAATGRPVGFVFMAEDGFWFLDIDNALEQSPAGAQWSALATDLCTRLAGAAIEVSQSGKGLHIIGRGTVPEHSCKNVPLGLELYTQDRFVALTGLNAAGDASTDHSATISAIAAGFFPPNPHGEIAGWTAEPVPDWGGPADDATLLKAALASGKSNPAVAFDPRHICFEDLWTADAEKLAAKWPSDKGGYDASHADAALAAHLAFWTGKNCERIRDLMLQSDLARQKWVDRPEWLETTIMRSCAVTSNVARGPEDQRVQRLREDQRIGDDVGFAVLPSVVTLDDAHKEFVFIGDGAFIASRTTKTIRKYNDATKEYAASKHPVDTGKFNTTGRPEMKLMPVVTLWLGSPSRLSADIVTWAPGEPEFCHALERLQAGVRAYNLWVPPRLLSPPPDWEEKAKPFLQHVEYLVPVETERLRFLRWLAHIFQRPGELPHTAYLMVATETGIGRGTLASILTRALRGYVAANMNVDALFGGFNGRISQKLLATVDEIREGNSTDRYKKAEALKSKITEETRALNPKYGSQSVEKNCCRWLMFSNHNDALPFDNNDRRLIVIANPSERKSPAWYAHLHGLLNNPAFVASVQHYFITLDLTGFNPYEPAPINEAKMKALAALESPAARACRNFVEQWPGELAARSDLVAFIGHDSPSGRALDHDIERAGMRTVRHQRIGPTSGTVLIVRGPLTPEDVTAVSASAVADRILSARAAFIFMSERTD